MTARALPEVPEGDAAGTIAATYADIRGTLGVPVVNLIYRHLAAEPGRLESTWNELRPNLAHPATHALAAELARGAERARQRVGAPHPAGVADRGSPSADVLRARATVSVYERANGLNLLVASALLSGAPGVGESGSAPGEPGPGAGDDEILPMAEIAAVDERTRTILDEMSAAVTPPGRGTLTPSLFRHLASSPEVLRSIWESVGPSLGTPEVRLAADQVRQEAAELVCRLPCRVDRTATSSVRAILERFTSTMAAMLVVGRILDDVLGH